MDGVFLIDKPKGMSSHRVVSKLRRILQQKKIGHAGTLDPLATGLLICCVGTATKISSYLMGHDKVYEAEITLGSYTSTYDAEGKQTFVTDVMPDLPDVQKAVQGLIGTIDQTPPLYSAIKVDGKKLYQYARQDISVSVPSRRVRIDAIDIISYKKSVVRIKVACEKGTYIRSLAHDIGQTLGCGGYASLIHRVQSGSMHVDDATTLKALEDMEVQNMPALNIYDALEPMMLGMEISPDQALHIQQGKPVQHVFKNLDHEGMLMAHTPEKKVIALLSCEAGHVELKRVI